MNRSLIVLVIVGCSRSAPDAEPPIDAVYCNSRYACQSMVCHSASDAAVVANYGADVAPCTFDAPCLHVATALATGLPFIHVFGTIEELAPVVVDRTVEIDAGSAAALIGDLQSRAPMVVCGLSVVGRIDVLSGGAVTLESVQMFAPRSAP